MYDQGVKRLCEADIPDAKLDARLLLEFVCGTDRNTLLVYGDKERSKEETEKYNELIKRRADRIPLQHLTNEQEFMGLSFYVDENVLIPRQDTEILVEEAMLHLKDGMRILDMCTGSGCILLSLLHYSNECEGVGVDLSPEALKVAQKNAVNLQENPRFIESNLFEKVEGKFGMIVSNPPYIETNVVATLMPEVKDHEPMMALDGMEDGLFFYRKIVEEARHYLYDGAGLFFEIGYNQGKAVSSLMEKNGFRDVKITKDYAGLDRVVSGFWQRR